MERDSCKLLLPSETVGILVVIAVISLEDARLRVLLLLQLLEAACAGSKRPLDVAAKVAAEAAR